MYCQGTVLNGCHGDCAVSQTRDLTYRKEHRKVKYLPEALQLDSILPRVLNVSVCKTYFSHLWSVQDGWFK